MKKSKNRGQTPFSRPRNRLKIRNCPARKGLSVPDFPIFSQLLTLGLVGCRNQPQASARVGSESSGVLPICPSVQATIGNVDIRDWDERYRLGDSDLAPTALVVETTRQAPPGSALDLACGAGRNALWLAEHGWSVTAVDGAPAAIDILLKRASERALRVEAFVADLEKGEYPIHPSGLAHAFCPRP